MSSSVEITPELMAGFLDEAPEYLDMLDAGLMEFESKAESGVLSLQDSADLERMNTMFRAAHSLKGLAAAFGFDKIKDLTHRMETLFDQVRMGKRALAAESFETLFGVFDRLKALVEELSDQSMPPVDIEDVLEGLNRVLEQPTPARPAADDSGPDAAAVTDTSTGLQDAASSRIDQDGPSGETEVAGEDAQLRLAQNPAQGEVFGDPETAALFLEATSEALEEMNQGLLMLEENPTDPQLLNTIFRCAHNIKGASGAAGLVGMNQITHGMETVFDQLRNKCIAPDEELMNTLFMAVDHIREVIDSIRSGQLTDVDADEWGASISKWSRTQGVRSEPFGGGDTPAAPEDAGRHVQDKGADDAREAADGIHPAQPPRPPVDLRKGQHLVAVTFRAGLDEASIQAYMIHNRLGDLGKVVSTNPDIDSLQGDTPLDAIEFIVESTEEPEVIERTLSAYDTKDVLVTRGQGTAETADSRPDVSPDGALATPAEAAASTPVGEEAPFKVPSTQIDGATRGRQAETTRPPAGGMAGKPAKPDQTLPKTGETLRVDQERLDRLMNLAGELIINRARFTQIHGRFREVFDGKNLGYLVDDLGERLSRFGNYLDNMRTRNGNSHQVEQMGDELLHIRQDFNSVCSLVGKVHELRPSMYDFDEALHAMNRVSDGIQKGIMGTRMVPIGPLFNRFRRVVRDLCKSTGKQVELVLRGEQTELDKRMVDELGDPLTHMVRNSVDHGLETPDVRKAAGKSAKGTLILEACHRGNNICIEVADDGAGINIERVKAKIIERELATSAQVEQMSDRELIQHILKPGFSTAQVVTDLSGRGMGMDIVVSKIEKLSGTIEVDSTEGEGTRVVIKLPLTMAILTSMVARIGGGIYAIPLEAVREIITVRREQIQWVQRRRVVRVRERVVPVALFEQIFETSQPELQTQTADSDEFALMIIGFENEQVGLAVDELLGQEDVVIKSIAENYRNVRGISGASIRGDGTVSLILDIGAMMEMAVRATSSQLAT